MKPLRALVSAALPLLFCLARPTVGEVFPEAGRAFRADLATRVQAAQAQRAVAVAGREGWLFLTAELRFLSLETFWGGPAGAVSRVPKPDLADPLPAILDFHQQLKARGVQLILVPVPPKAAIYPDKLEGEAPGHTEGASTAPLQRFYQELKTQGVEVLDLAPTFLATRQAGAAPDLFCRTDTHWSGDGCVVAAKVIAERVRTLLPPSTSSFSSSWLDQRIDGDLASLLPTGTPHPGSETIRLRQVKTSSGAAVEADPASPVLLLGDSHTLVFHEFAGQRAGLLDQLALELGIVPDLIGTRGSGSTAVRVSLYRKSVKESNYLAKKKVVVWCFTAREFSESDQGWSKLPVAK